MPQAWIGVLGALIMAGALAGIYYLVVKQNAVIGTKTIQFLAIAFVLPLLMVLGITNILGRDAISAIIGTVVGYALSSPWKD